MNARWLRWAGMRALVRGFPGLGRRFSFPLVSLRAVEQARTVLEDKTETIHIEATPAQIESILLPAMANDLGDTSTYPQARSLRYSQAALLDDCDIAGHTNTILRRSDNAMLHFRNGIPDWNLSKPVRLRERPVTPGIYVVLDRASHYFHFLSDDVAPLLSYLDRLHPPGETLHVVFSRDAAGFKREGLKALAKAYPSVKLVEVAADERLTGATVLWLSRIGATHEWMPIDRAMVDKWRDILLAHYPVPPSVRAPARRLFIGRKGAKLRRLKNEDEIAAMLAKEGFAPFAPDANDQRSQIEAFGGADIIVAVHGAALTNLVFCRPGTRVVEIFPSNFIKSPYLWLAAKLGLKYQGFFAGNGDYWQAFEANAQDLQRLVWRIIAETAAGLRPDSGLSKEASLSAAPLARPPGPLEDE
jgi:hypothetical protein